VGWIRGGKWERERESERSLMTKAVFVELIKETDSGLSLLKLMQFYYYSPRRDFQI